MKTSVYLNIVICFSLVSVAMARSNVAPNRILSSACGNKRHIRSLTLNVEFTYPMNEVARAEKGESSKSCVIPYLPLQRQLGLSVAASALAVCASSLAVIVAWRLLNLPASLLPWSVALCLSSFAFILLFVAIEKKMTKEVSLKISDAGIAFPYMFKPDLLFRTEREWSDIAHVLIGSFKDREPGAYEFELEKEKDAKHKVFIYFKSGGHAHIDLRRISKRGIELLFIALEPYCLDLSRSPQLRVSEDKHLTSRGEKNSSSESPQSFTELWEQEMQDHFSATNFVPLKKGKLLRSGRLRVLMQIAAGGLSAIYLAETPEKELRVIKESTLPPTLDEALREKAKELFTREATILQKLSHPKIAKVLDYFIEEGRDYLVLEFVPGHTIRQLVRQHGRMSEAQALNYAKQVAEILYYLHSQVPPVLHRDVTPDNLVLREDGEIVIIDFGAANEVLGTATGTLIGKQAYIAPEQFRGRAVPQSDLYGLGASMYFMLTGKDPEALAASTPRSVNEYVSPATDDLIANCTNVDSAERVASADALIENIDRILSDGGGAVITTGSGTLESS